MIKLRTNEVTHNDIAYNWFSAGKALTITAKALNERAEWESTFTTLSLSSGNDIQCPTFYDMVAEESENLTINWPSSFTIDEDLCLEFELNASSLGMGTFPFVVSLKPKPMAPEPEPEEVKPEVAEVKPEVAEVKPVAAEVKPEVAEAKPEVAEAKPEAPKEKPCCQAKKTEPCETVCEPCENPAVCWATVAVGAIGAAFIGNWVYKKYCKKNVEE